jgi:VIT1/CCC1 family predicted Fe2+/Mn2+ transporter
MLAIAGFPYARDREHGWSIAALIAAVLPTFGVLYVIGLSIFQHLGPGVAGGLLIGGGSVLVSFTAWQSLKLRSGQRASR